MSSVRITGLAANLIDQYGNTLVVEWVRIGPWVVFDD